MTIVQNLIIQPTHDQRALTKALEELKIEKRTLEQNLRNARQKKQNGLIKKLLDEHVKLDEKENKLTQRLKCQARNCSSFLRYLNLPQC